MVLTGVSIRFRMWTRIGIALFISMLFGIWAGLWTRMWDYGRYSDKGFVRDRFGYGLECGLGCDGACG